MQYKAETDVQWTEAEIEAVNVDREFYAGGYTLPQLRPATVYMTRVASQNSYGYNDFGEIFKFATKGAGECCLDVLFPSFSMTYDFGGDVIDEHDFPYVLKFPASISNEPWSRFCM